MTLKTRIGINTSIKLHSETSRTVWLYLKWQPLDSISWTLPTLRTRGEGIHAGDGWMERITEPVIIPPV